MFHGEISRKLKEIPEEDKQKRKELLPEGIYTHKGKLILHHPDEVKEEENEKESILNEIEKDKEKIIEEQEKIVNEDQKFYKPEIFDMDELPTRIVKEGFLEKNIDIRILQNKFGHVLVSNYLATLRNGKGRVSWNKFVTLCEMQNRSVELIIRDNDTGEERHFKTG